MAVSRKMISLFLILAHLVVVSTPLFYSSLLRADALSELSQNMTIMRSELPVSGENPPVSSFSTASDIPAQSSPSNYPISQPEVAVTEVVAIEGQLLPDLMVDDLQKSLLPTVTEQKIQSGIQSFWSVMGSDDPAQSGLNQATTMASGLATNAVRDWLSHKGNARIEFNTRGKSQGQILVPVWESEQNVLFSQLGVVNTSERTIYHVGAGVRNYIHNDWMLGINTFWDYDNTGGNARVGIGAEAWTSSLKLAVNGYIPLTDWHQSPLASMRDYDERPARGFDIRAETWLPAYPQITANLKYEKYYGEGVVLGGSTNPGNMSDSPHAYTAGLAYTPIPLITFGAEHKRGSISDTLVSLSLNYRFGLSWKELTDSRLVKVARSLAGQRYDFVDRNYDIVMQYRKQDLVSLALPPSLTAEASSSLKLEAKVTAKYGLKSVSWNTSEILLAGGMAIQQSDTDILLTLPPYRENTANSFTVSAVATDVNGNSSPESRTRITLIRSSNTVSLAVSPSSNLIANGTEVSTATATVTDNEGNPLGLTNIEFHITGDDSACLMAASTSCSTTIATNSQGVAQVRIGHLTAGVHTLRAYMDNGNSAHHTLNFIADRSTARIESLVANTQGAIANGIENEELTVTVYDASGNPVSDVVVSIGVTGGANISSSTVTTNAMGKGTFTVNSPVAGSFIVNAAINGTSGQATVTFRADATTATLASGALTVTANDALANNLAINSVQAVVTDAGGNRVSGVVVNFSTDDNVSISPLSAITGEDGTVNASLISTRAGVASVTATVNSSHASAEVNFIPDISTAIVSLITVHDHALANTIAQNRVTAQVADIYGNALGNIVVAFTAGNGAVISPSASTNDQGIIEVGLTSSVAGTSSVTASISGSTSTTSVIFVADISTASILMNVLADSALANSVAQNHVQATVTDAHGNPVPGVNVTFGANNGATVTDAAITNTEGQVEASITSTLAGASQITASISGSTDTKTVMFIADISTAAITLSVVADGAIANATMQNRVQALVTDAHGNSVSGVNVEFSASNGAIVASSVVTDAFGVAEVTLTNTIAGASQVTGIISGSITTAMVMFIADISTASITLHVASDNAVANAVAQNSVQAMVSDANGNPVPGVTISFSADNGAVVTSTAMTDSSGMADVRLTSTHAGLSQVVATISGSTSTATVTFVADSSTAVININVVVDNAVANAIEQNRIQAVVIDANGNPVPGTVISFNADNGAVITANATTDTSGLAEISLTSVNAGLAQITATISGSESRATVMFVADSHTATVVLNVVSDNALANTVAQNSIQAMVTDANGNPVPGVTISFGANNGAVVTTTATTDTFGTAEASLTSATAGTSQVTATIPGSTHTIMTTFIADISTASLMLSVVADDAIANGVAQNFVLATVSDAHGNPLSGVDISFSANNSATISTSASTDTSGQVEVGLTSTLAGFSQVTATITGGSGTTSVHFIADTSTAVLDPIESLTVTANNAVANGIAQNTVLAVVTDAHGNAVSGVEILFTASNGATITPAGLITDTAGRAIASLTSLVAGAIDVTATVTANGSTQNVTTTFIADATTAELISGSLLVTDDNAVANGIAQNSVQAVVTDANGNPVSGVEILFTASNGATITPAAVTTDTAGRAVASLTSLIAGSAEVTATVTATGSTQSVTTNFIADATTAELISGSLLVIDDNAIANGIAQNSVQAVVTDANGNPVSGVEILFTASNGATITPAGVTTDTAGRAIASLTSLTAGSAEVTATVTATGSIQSAGTVFVADISTAALLLEVIDDGKVANGIAQNKVLVSVADAHGNPVINTALSVEVTNSAVAVPVNTVTNAEGQAEITVTSIVSGQVIMTVLAVAESQSLELNFVPDPATGTLSLVWVNNQSLTIANNRDLNEINVIAVDANNNILSNTDVHITLSGGMNINGASTLTMTTDGNGIIVFSVMSPNSGELLIKAALVSSGNESEINVRFSPAMFTLHL